MPRATFDEQALRVLTVGMQPPANHPWGPTAVHPCQKVAILNVVHSDATGRARREFSSRFPLGVGSVFQMTCGHSCKAHIFGSGVFFAIQIYQFTMAPSSNHGPTLPPWPTPPTIAPSPHPCRPNLPHLVLRPTQPLSQIPTLSDTSILALVLGKAQTQPASICSPPCLPRWRCTRAPSQSAGGPRVRGRGSVEAWRGRGRQAAGGHAAHGSPKCSPVVCAPMTVGITGTTRIKDNHLLVFLSCFHFRFHFEFELIFSQFELGCET